MKLFKKLKQIFCFHHWIPIKIINAEIYNEYDIRYARCKSVCCKCNKTKYIDYMMRSEYQNRLNNIKE